MRNKHVVILSPEAFLELQNAVPAASRFTNVEEWGFSHIWMYSPNGDVLIFTDQAIQKLQSREIFNLGVISNERPQ